MKKFPTHFTGGNQYLCKSNLMNLIQIVQKDLLLEVKGQNIEP